MDLSLCDTVFVLWHVLHPWHSSMGDLLSEATNKLNYLHGAGSFLRR